jgi:6-pyruvoyltetrahydropterin/6-carboxytetrahydropterin synthase
MYEVSVDETFAAAHNLRGHNYKVRVTLAGSELDSVGLLYDFVHLKQVIQGVIRSLDHKYLNELKPFDLLNPSAENIAKHIYEEAAKQMRETPNGAAISSITVWETDVTAATYRP